MGSIRQSGLRALALCVLAGATYLALALMSAPPPLPADAPAAEFSAGRAMQNLAVIAREPRPMGVSQAHAAVRDYLLGETRALGLEPEVQKTFGVRLVSAGWVIAGAVENILVRLPGTDPEGAILLTAHYDSAPGVPGAADNGSGVVTLLELLRALQAGPPLRQDVIVFFTDGEEPGTIGTHAFVAQHPWFHDVRGVINLDTITDAPPTLVPESGGSGPWIRALARSASRPAFASLPFDLFPGGDTDLLPFAQAGVPSADLYAAGGFPELHTAEDRIEIVNPAAVQHVGDQLLALVRTLGDQPTFDERALDQTFFPILGRLVHYPTGWALPLAILAGLVYAGTLLYGFRKGELTWRGLGLGFVAFLVGLVLSVATANLLWSAIQAVHPQYGYSVLHPHLSDDWLYAVTFIAFTLAVYGLLIAVLRKRTSGLDLASGALAMWVPAGIAAAIVVPATSYLASWTLLAGSLALVLGLAVAPRAGLRPLSGVGFLASAVLVTWLWVPVISTAYLGAFTMVSILVGLAALWLGSIMPILEWISAPKRWMLPTAAALVAVGSLVAGHILVGIHSPPPLINPMGYWLDASTGEASWIAFSEALDERQSRILVDPLRRPYTEIFPEAPPYTVLTTAAPALDLAGPYLDVVDDGWVDGRRALRLRTTTSMHDRLYVIVPPDALVLALTIPHNGRMSLPPCDGAFVLRFDGMPVEGVEVGFELDADGPVEVLLVEERTGLPSFPGLPTEPQPGTMRTPGEFYQAIPTDFTAIRRDYTIQGLD
jgi:hypothetical protein